VSKIENQIMYIWLMILQKWAWIPLLLIGLMLTACEEIEEEKPWLQVERPEMLFTDTTLMDSYDKGVLAWKLKTAYLERWGDKEIVFVRPVLVDIYDSLGERTAFLRADSGRMDLKFTYVYAYGHVYALTPKGASVRSDSLIWNKKDNLVKTDSYVRVVSEEGDVLQGQGFVSDAHMDNWRILSNVTGIFQDAARRLKEEDKNQAKEIESRDSAQAVTSSSSVATKVATPVAKSSSATASKPAKATPDAPATKQDSLAEKARRNALNAIRGTVLRPKAKTRNE
jgi:LPS export ABC transporter protein LptC